MQELVDMQRAILALYEPLPPGGGGGAQRPRGDGAAEEPQLAAPLRLTKQQLRWRQMRLEDRLATLALSPGPLSAGGVPAPRPPPHLTAALGCRRKLRARLACPSGNAHSVRGREHACAVWVRAVAVLPAMVKLLRSQASTTQHLRQRASHLTLSRRRRHIAHLRWTCPQRCVQSPCLTPIGVCAARAMLQPCSPHQLKKLASQ